MMAQWPETTSEALCLRKGLSKLFEVPEKPLQLPEKISVLFVTSQNESADHLSALLNTGKVSIEVEWVDAVAGRLDTVKRRLAEKTSQDPSIVLLDYQTCGASVWPFIASCATSMPGLKIEWIVTHYTGSVPVLPNFPWHNVTIIGDSIISH